MMYFVEKAETFKTIQTLLTEKFQFRKESAPAAEHRIYDTFDWRLFKENLILSRDSRGLTLSNFESGLSWQQPHPFNASLAFAADLSEGPIQSQLLSLLDVRSLMALLTQKTQRDTFHILNEDEKTVLRIHFVERLLTRPQEQTASLYTIETETIRGYDAWEARFQTEISGQAVSALDMPVMVSVLRKAGYEPGDYSSKFKLKMDPASTALEAARALLQELLAAIRANEAGTIEDVDIEFLHDFRVSMRRTRSALSLIKGVLPADQADAYKNAFAEQQKKTNRLRDLDVYLLEEQAYKSMLPPDLRPGLNPLFSRLKRERGRSQRAVAKHLQSDVYIEHIKSWEAFLNTDLHCDSAAEAETPVTDYARKLIMKKYLRVIRDGRKIKQTSPDEMVHDLRIDCKKLRYTMEFFASLFDKKQMDYLIGQLKQLQDNLGVFNDLYVQQEQIKSELQKIGTKALPLESAAMGGLLAVLHVKQKDVRQAFKKRFDQFASAKNEKLFRILFN